VAKWQTQRTY